MSSLLQGRCLSSAPSSGLGRNTRIAATRSGFPPRNALRPATGKPGARSRKTLRVEANELNKWGDRDAREGDTDPGLDDDGFERDTMKVINRLLTARSVQRLIMQLQETDVRVSSWLSDFCSKNSPMEGDKFLQKLLKAQPTTVEDKYTGSSSEISPFDLAERLIIVRHSLAKGMSGLPGYVANCNLEVYRLHVESGIAKEKPKYRRR